jgi:orotate phosphoribosyltransferase
MNDQQILEVLERRGAILTNDHFVYTSGKHGSAYVNKDAIYPYTQDISKICLEMARKAYAYGCDPDVVIGPALGGIILSQWVASAFSEGVSPHEVLAVYAEKEGEGFVIKRGYAELLKGENVLIVEDVLTTGGSAKKVAEAVRAAGGQPIGLFAICNRGNVANFEVGCKVHSLLEIPLKAWPEQDCPLCKQGIPVNVKVGKGREFLAKKEAIPS